MTRCTRRAYGTTAAELETTHFTNCTCWKTVLKQKNDEQSTLVSVRRGRDKIVQSVLEIVQTQVCIGYSLDKSLQRSDTIDS